MADFKVIYRADNEGAGHKVLWEPGCPVLIEAVQVSRNTDTGEAFLQVKVENVSGDAVGGVTVDASVAYSSGPAQEVELRDLDADISPAHSYTFKPVKLDDGDVVGVDAVVTSTAGKAGWAAAGTAAEVPAPKPLSLSAKAIGERKARLGESGNSVLTVNRAPVVGDGWWVCGCGQVNVSADTCQTCHASLKTLRTLEDQAQLETWADEREAVRKRQAYAEAKSLQGKGDAGSLERAVSLFDSLGAYEDAPDRASHCRTELAKAKKAQSGKRRAIVIAAVAVVVIAIAAYFVVTNVVIPSGKYDEAAALAESGEYEKAIAAFEELGDYRDAGERADSVRYEQASSLFDEGKYSDAVEIFTSILDYGDSKEKCYEAASNLFDGGKYKEAMAGFDALGSYSDSKERKASIQVLISDKENKTKLDTALSMFDDATLEKMKDDLQKVTGPEITAILPGTWLINWHYAGTDKEIINADGTGYQPSTQPGGSTYNWGRAWRVEGDTLYYGSSYSTGEFLDAYEVRKADDNTYVWYKDGKTASIIAKKVS